jgi:hypothetical protein
LSDSMQYIYLRAKGFGSSAELPVKRSLESQYQPALKQAKVKIF